MPPSCVGIRFAREWNHTLHSRSQEHTDSFIAETNAYPPPVALGPDNEERHHTFNLRQLPLDRKKGLEYRTKLIVRYPHVRHELESLVRVGIVLLNFRPRHDRIPRRAFHARVD